MEPGRCRPAYTGVLAQMEQILKSKPKRINDFKEESEMLSPENSLGETCVHDRSMRSQALKA